MALITAKYNLRGEEFDMAYLSFDNEDLEDWVLSKDPGATVSFPESLDPGHYNFEIAKTGLPTAQAISAFSGEDNWDDTWVVYGFRVVPTVIDYWFAFVNASDPQVPKISVTGL
jgi:hypothetical protein